MKFIIDNIFLIVLALASGGALIANTMQHMGAKVTVLQATRLLNQGKIVVVDVRSAEEFAAGHIRDARNIQLKELKDRATELDKFKERPIIVVCNKGLQSNRAASILKKAGFGNAVALLGGMDDWKSQGLPISKLRNDDDCACDDV